MFLLASTHTNNTQFKNKGKINLKTQLSDFRITFVIGDCLFQVGSFSNVSEQDLSAGTRLFNLNGYGCQRWRGRGCDRGGSSWVGRGLSKNRQPFCTVCINSWRMTRWMFLGIRFPVKKIIYKNIKVCTGCFKKQLWQILINNHYLLNVKNVSR